MSTKPYWPLCADVFTLWDKLKISSFLFRERIWTYGKYVRSYEEKWERYLGGRSHAIMTSSGSSANELIALRRKWELQRAGEWPHRNKVVFPVNTWISSVSPWINFGFEPVFVDVELDTLNMSASELTKALVLDTREKRIGTVFNTVILGYWSDVEYLKEIADSFGVRYLLDNCEASFTDAFLPSTYPITLDRKSVDIGHLCNLTTCSTSVFYSHLTPSGTEGGLIFTQSQEEADWFRMARNHGMTRGMPEKYRNKSVGADFDFYLLPFRVSLFRLFCFYRCSRRILGHREKVILFQFLY